VPRPVYNTVLVRRSVIRCFRPLAIAFNLTRHVGEFPLCSLLHVNRASFRTWGPVQYQIATINSKGTLHPRHSSVFIAFLRIPLDVTEHNRPDARACVTNNAMPARLNSRVGRKGHDWQRSSGKPKGVHRAVSSRFAFPLICHERPMGKSDSTKSEC